MLGLLLLLPRDKESATTLSKQLPPRGEKYGERNEEQPESADNAEVAPDMAMAKGHGCKIFITCEARRTKLCANNTST